MEFTFVMDFSISVLDSMPLQSFHILKKPLFWVGVVIALAIGVGGMSALYKKFKNKWSVRDNEETNAPGPVNNC